MISLDWQFISAVRVGRSVRISLLVKHFSVWISSSVYSQILVVYSVFSIQLRVVCRVWFSADTSDRSEQGTHTCFGSGPMDQAPGSTSSFLPHREDSIPSWSLCYHLLICINFSQSILSLCYLSTQILKLFHQLCQAPIT
jgi:hypothetical protein